jgi:ATP/maltotriose-dependent transcriptional regulator MalT
MLRLVLVGRSAPPLHRYRRAATIAEYFVDEVLRIQPPHVRTLLPKAGILDTFTPEPAEVVTGRADAGRLLAALCRQNAFVQPAGDGGVPLPPAFSAAGWRSVTRL